MSTTFLITLLGLWAIGFVYLMYKFNSKPLSNNLRQIQTEIAAFDQKLEQAKESAIKLINDAKRVDIIYHLDERNGINYVDIRISPALNLN